MRTRAESFLWVLIPLPVRWQKTKLIWDGRAKKKTSEQTRSDRSNEEQLLGCLFIYLPSGWCKREMCGCAGGEGPGTVQRTASCGTDRDRDENDTCGLRHRSRSCDRGRALTYVSRERRVRPRKSGRRAQDQTLPVTGATTGKQTTHDHDTRQGKSHTYRRRY